MMPEGPSAQADPPPDGQRPAASPVLKGRYEVGERLAEGTFFFTHRGSDLETGRTCAVKVLKPEFAADKAFLSYLETECQRAAGLQHPNLAQVYDVWRERGTLVIVTEWVRGINLSERIARVAPFPLAVSMDIGLALAQALNHAHEKGIVHGDVRPGNVIITPDGRVKLTDFGVGAALAARAGGSLTAFPSVLRCASPELIEGKGLDPRSDLYSLGCTLYEMLTGEPTYKADSAMALAAQHLRDEPPNVQSANPSMPNAPTGLVYKCLQKDRGNRYATATDLLQDIHQIRDALRANESLDWSPMKPAAGPAAKSTRSRPANPPPRAKKETRPRAEPAVVVDSGPSWKLLLGLFLFFLALLATGFGMVVVWTSAPQEVTVPAQLAGMRQADAVEFAKKVGLVPQVKDDFSERVPEGVVIRTDPKGGVEVRGGKPVLLYVSRGPQPIKVPELIGKKLEAATKELEAAGLVLGKTDEEWSEVIPKGQIMAQLPMPGDNARKQATVKLTLSKGPQPIDEPARVDVDPDRDGPADPANPDEPEPEPEPETDPSQPRADLPISRNEVSFQVPQRATGEQRVRIVVRNEDGKEETVYEQRHNPGDMVTEQVATAGRDGKCQIRVYLNDRIIYRQTGPPFR